MNKRITEAFEKGKAFIPFITCGDPSLEVTEQLVYAMEEAGADLIELGIPFSDPTAEGPVIQRANVRALSGGVTTDKVFDMVVKIRKNSSVPMVFMTYANVVFSYGTERFIKTAAEIGMDGLILPDVPFEEKEEFDTVCKKYGIDLISLIAPTSHERIAQIAKDAEGFVYCVSSLGVTGTRTNITTDIGAMVKLVKQERYSLCSWIWHFYAGTGEEDGGAVRWSDCRICNCEVVCTVWQGLCALCERVCEVYERCCNGSLGIKKGRAETYFISCAVSEPKNF
jgi:tryptophan synthase alpha chain